MSKSDITVIKQTEGKIFLEKGKSIKHQHKQKLTPTWKISWELRAGNIPFEADK